MIGFVPILSAKSVLLKNGRVISKVQVKTVEKGFAVTYPDGRMEHFSLSEVKKILISDFVPKENPDRNVFKKEETLLPEIPKLESETNAPKFRTKTTAFAEGLIPGWSRLVRSDSYSLKSLGLFFIFAEIFLLKQNYLYLAKSPKAAMEGEVTPSPIAIAIMVTGSPEATATLQNIASAYSYDYFVFSDKVVLSDGSVMERSRYNQERQMYFSGFICVLLLDAFLGSKFENWSVIPNVNVSFQSKDVSAGITFRF